MDDSLAMRGGEGPTDLVQHPGGPFEVQGSILERLGQVPSPQEPHHEVRTTGIAPVVVQGDDVRVLQAGDDLRLGLEPADELGIVRETRGDRLDRDVTTDHRLDRPIHGAERSLADLLEQPVAAQRLALEIELWVLAEDPLMQRTKVM